MTGADFRKATLTTEGRLSGIVFRNADLTGANFEEASLAVTTRTTGTTTTPT